jgi:hypothetical protein
MGALTRKTAPEPEGVTFDGTNAEEVVALVQRVAALGAWSPLDDAELSYEIRDEEPHLGLNVTKADGTIVARVEEGNTLVFDLFATTPLFVLAPHELDAFYGGN